MSLISANPIFSKLSHLAKCCSTQLYNKTNYNVLNFCGTYTASSLSRNIEVNQINKQAEKTLTECNTAVLKKVNEEQKYYPTRTFAVVQVCGKQFKVTTGDVIIIEGYWPPDVGDQLRLDKVLCAGGVNFSVFGTPLVQPGLVDVQATVIEKTLSHTKTHFRKKRRKQYMNINFYRTPRIVLRINDVGIGLLKETVDEY